MVQGHLFKYDSEKDKNFLVAKDSFICVDRMEGSNSYQYILNVTDGAQKFSYTRIEIKKDFDLNYSFSEVEKMLMWIGIPKEDSTEIPAWSFFIKINEEVPRLKGVLLKVLYESNLQESFEKNQEKEDNSWLEAQIVGDQDQDADMDGIEKIETYEYDDIFIEDSFVKVMEDEEDDELDELENSESVQAHTYDRTFVVQGPVVKIYKEADEQSSERGIKYETKLPRIKNEAGEYIRPTSVILHKGESNMIFTDANDTSQIFNYDLEHGKIVEQFNVNNNLSEIRHLTNQFKNA